MIINCNFCEATAKGNQAELQDKGWSRVVIFAPVRKTITACPLHHEEAGKKMLEVLPGRFRKKDEGDVKLLTPVGLYEEHDKCVKELIDAGEKILQPKGKPHNHILAYLKNEKPPRHYGHIRKGIDGTYELMFQLGAYTLKGIKKSELGLCDAQVWDENKAAIHTLEDIRKNERIT